MTLRVLLVALAAAGVALGQVKLDAPPPTIPPQKIPAPAGPVDETPRFGGVIAVQPGETLRDGVILVPGRPNTWLHAETAKGPEHVAWVRGLAAAERAGQPSAAVQVGGCANGTCGMPGGVHAGYYRAPQLFTGWRVSGSSGCSGGSCAKR